MRDIVVYLHGFNAAPEPLSEKRRLLEKMCADRGYNFYSPAIDYTDLDASIAQLEADIMGDDVMTVTFVGTAAGAFLAEYLAQKFSDETVACAVMINPVIRPATVLQEHIGQQTNAVTDETTQWTARHCDDLRRFEGERDRFHGPVPILVLVDKGDEVIDHVDVKFRFADRARIVQYPGGSHQFDHMEQAIVEIEEFVSAIAG